MLIYCNSSIFESSLSVSSEEGVEVSFGDLETAVGILEFSVDSRSDSLVVVKEVVDTVQH